MYTLESLESLPLWSKIAIGVCIAIIIIIIIGLSIYLLLPRTSENYANPCDSCYDVNNPDVCNCLRVNNCNLPNQCKKNECTQDGINKFVNNMNNDIFTCSKSSLCDNINSQNVKTNCLRQCNQSSGPFRGLPPLADCCDKACSSLDCSKNTEYRKQRCAAGGNRGSLPKGTTAPCQICKDVCRMGPEYCQRCKNDNKCS